MAKDLRTQKEKSQAKDISENTGTTNPSGNELVVDTGRIPSPLEQALIDSSKDVVKGSIDQSREFHKTMLGLTATFSTLMASSFSILAFGKKEQPLDNFQRLFLIVSVLLMIASSIIFALGYYPRTTMIGLCLNKIKEEREAVLKKRGTYARMGLLLFVLALVVLIAGIMFFNIAPILNK